MIMKTRCGYRVLDSEDDEEAKSLLYDIGGRWAASEGNDLVSNDDGIGGKSGSKSGRINLGS